MQAAYSLMLPVCSFYIPRFLFFISAILFFLCYGLLKFAYTTYMIQKAAGLIGRVYEVLCKHYVMCSIVTFCFSTSKKKFLQIIAISRSTTKCISHNDIQCWPCICTFWILSHFNRQWQFFVFMGIMGRQRAICKNWRKKTNQIFVKQAVVGYIP